MRTYVFLRPAEIERCVWPSPRLLSCSPTAPFLRPYGFQQSHYCFCHPLFFFSSGSVGPSGDLVRVSLVRQSVKCKTSFLETSTRDPKWHSSYLLHSQDGLQANSLCVFVCVCLREHFSSSVDHKRMLVAEQWQPLTSIGFDWIQ